MLAFQRSWLGALWHRGEFQLAWWEYLILHETNPVKSIDMQQAGSDLYRSVMMLLFGTRMLGQSFCLFAIRRPIRWAIQIHRCYVQQSFIYHKDMIWGYFSVNSRMPTIFSQIPWGPTCWRAKCAVFFWTAWVPTLIRSRCEREIPIARGGWWFWSRDTEATEVYVVDMSEGPRTSWTVWHTLLCLEIWGSRTLGGCMEVGICNPWCGQSQGTLLNKIALSLYIQMDYFPVDDYDLMY